MTSIADLMSHHHRDCDACFAEAEALAADGDWSRASEALAAFSAQLLAHFAAEEDTLFPRFEHVTGLRAGPTQVMRAEHAQMREMLAALRDALDDEDAEGFGGEAETLLILLQQHNMKEENILYPMCDQYLAGEAPALSSQLDDALKGAATCPP